MKFFGKAAIAAALISLTTPLSASAATGSQTISQPLAATATVAANCSFSVPPTLVFGPYDPIITNLTAAATTTATPTANCTRAWPISVSVATDGILTNTVDASTLTFTAVLSGSATQNGKGSGSTNVNSFLISGSIPGAQNPTAGNYANVAANTTVTISF